MSLSRRREKLVARLGRRSTREREALVLVEGIRAVDEALDAGAGLRFALVSPRLDALGGGEALRLRLRASGGDVDEVSDEELTRVSDTDTPQGVLAVCAEPRPELETLLERSGRYLVLDAVQDPGNAGTLVRAATAFGLDGVVALDGTVDPWNPKTVRASVGLAFRIPVLTVGAERWVDATERAAVPLLVADAAGEPVGRMDPGRSWALVVGNEGSGARPELRAVAEQVVRIPMPGPAESLNAGMAGAVLLYALTEARP